MTRWKACAAAAVCAAGTASAADVKWTYEGAVQALYSDNVYFTADNSGSAKTKGSAGGSISADVALKSATPRNELSASYSPSYRYYTSESGASNLEHFVALRWKALASPNTSFLINETASYTPESNNFKGRGVDQAFTVGPRVSQLRSTTGLGLSSRLSPRWTFNAGYAYRLLGNGKPDLGDQNGTAATLYDEDGHRAEVGVSYQLSPASTLSMKADYTVNRYEPNRGAVLAASSRTTSLGASVAYGWAVAERTSFTVGLGAYRSTQRSDPAAGPREPGTTSNDLSADVGLIRTYKRGSLSLGLARGLSTFDGLARTRQIPIDTDGDGTNDSVKTVTESLGSATRTTVHGSYSYKVSNDSTLGFDLNGTLREETTGSGRIGTVGAGTSYGLRFARWGGLLASYAYTRQHGSTRQGDSGSDGFSGRDIGTNAAQLGLFFAKP